MAYQYSALSFFCSTFKLVPKNVPPEALQDAKGVVFSCESDADVEKWCDVLNKAALGFIIQPSPRPEKGLLSAVTVGKVSPHFHSMQCLCAILYCTVLYCPVLRLALLHCT